MSPRAAELIRQLGLEPHPEGGHFRRVFCSEETVARCDGSTRPALTSIHFLLAEGEVSRWHRVLSDEAWHFHEGAPLELFLMPPEGGPFSRLLLGPPDGERLSLRVVPAGWWQAARSLGGFTLAGCSVGPGFDFADFTMLADFSGRASVLAKLPPALTGLV